MKPPPWSECTILGERFRVRRMNRRPGGDRLHQLEHPVWRNLSARGWSMEEAMWDLQQRVGPMYFRLHVGKRMPPEGQAYRDFLIKLVLGDGKQNGRDRVASGS